jgi:hypothetical protein
LSQQLQLRHDTAANWATVTPAQGEIVVDETNNRILVGDGSTAGGWPAIAPGLVGLVARGVNLNSVGDTAISVALPYGFSRYFVAGIRVLNASISLTTAQAAVYTGAGATGVTVVSPVALSAITATTANAPANMATLTLAITGASEYLNSATLYFRCTTAQGAAATADVSIAVESLS